MLRTSLQVSFPVDLAGMTCVQLGPDGPMMAGMEGDGGAGCSFQEEGLTRVKQSLTGEESDGVGGEGGGGGGGREEEGVD